MSKKLKDFQDIEKSIERLTHLSTEQILERINRGHLTEKGRKIYKAILKERGIRS
jgi:hypothetical protein